MSLATLWILTLLAATDPVPPATPPPAKLEFPLAGYRINAIEDSSTNGFCNFTMFLPISGNSHSMSASVSVISGPPMDTKPPLRFYPHSGDTILFKRAVSPTELLVEFTSKNVSTVQKEHSYWREVFTHGRTYTIDATAPDAQWPEFGPKLKACVDSFELSPDPAPGKLAFPQQGYRISALAGPVPADAHQPLLSMMGGMRPWRVSVTIEPYAKTHKDYQAERKPALMLDSKNKFEILAENAPAENALVTEYAEEFPAVKNHSPAQLLSYEKVILAHGQLYRVSAGFLLLNEADPKTLTQIKACVDSLEAIPPT